MFKSYERETKLFEFSLGTYRDDFKIRNKKKRYHFSMALLCNGFNLKGTTSLCNVAFKSLARCF